MSVASGAYLDWQFRLRSKMGAEEMKWTELQSLLNKVCLNTEEGEIIWGLSPSKTIYNKFFVQISYHRGELAIK
jgi:hypothetical protein